jgi:hypothetical protein
MNEGPASREQLNDLGNEGWELVSVVAGQNSMKLLYVFKRVKAAAVSIEAGT